MSKKMLQNYNYGGNMLIDFRFEKLAANPDVNPDNPGRIINNTTTGKYSVDTGTEYKNFLTDVAWGDITGIPTTFAPSTHVHSISAVTGLGDALNAKADIASPSFTGNPTAPTQPSGNDSQRIATTEFVQDAMSSAGAGDMLKSVYDSNDDGKVDSADAADAVPWDGITDKPDEFAPAAHTHTIADISDITAYGASLLDDDDAAAARTTLGLGELATLDDVNTAQISGRAVTNPKLANIATNTIKGRVDENTGQVQDLTADQVKTILSLGISDIADLQSGLDGKAAFSHTHTASDVSDFATEVDARVVALWDQIAGTDENVETIRETLNLILANAGTVQEQIARYNADIGDGTEESIAVTHNLNSLDVSVEVYEKDTGATVGVDVVRTNANVVTINANPVLAANAYRVVIKK